MSKNSNHKKSAVLFTLIASSFASTAYAGLASCSGTYNLGNSTAGLGSGGANSAGCEQVDKNFTTFNYSSGGSSPVAAGSVPVIFSGTSDAGPVIVQFGTSANATWDATVNGASVTGSVSYIIAVDPNPPAPYAPPAGEKYAIDKMALGQQAIISSGFGGGSAGDNITLTEYFCGGGASACLGGTAATGFINMSAATAGFLTYQQQGNSGGATSVTASCFNNGNTVAASDCATASNATASSSVVNFVGTNYTLGFQNVYSFSTFTVNSGGDQTSLNYFIEGYYQELDTPEPATFGMMGAALAGLVFLGLRKRS